MMPTMFDALLQIGQFRGPNGENPLAFLVDIHITSVRLYFGLLLKGHLTKVHVSMKEQAEVTNVVEAFETKCNVP